MTVLSTFRLAVIPLAIFIASPVFAADDPSMQQVYQTAKAGKFDEAQAMMDKVLRDHPNSAKAHFVEAELLAGQGRMIEAAPELAKAEKLAPGLPFADAAAVSKLKAKLAGSSGSLTPATSPVVQQPVMQQAPRPYVQQRQVAPSSGTPWGMIFLLIFIGIIAYVFISRRNTAAQGGGTPYIPAGPGGNNMFGNNAQAPGPYGNPGYGGGMGGPMGGQPGMGSRIAGGLATGAAVGAGIVAGEALMHHFTDRDNNNGNGNNNYVPPPQSYAPPDDLGGNNFGVSDGGSWDDGGSSGGGGGGDSDDWN